MLFANKYTLIENRFCSVFIEQNLYNVEGDCKEWKIDNIIFNTKHEIILDTIIENNPTFTGILENNKIGNVITCTTNCINNFVFNTNKNKNRVFLYKIKNNEIFKYKNIFTFPVLKNVNLNYEELLFRGILFNFKINKNEYNHYLMLQKPIYDEIDNHLNNLLKIKKYLNEGKLKYNLFKLNNKIRFNKKNLNIIKN
jgi:hypothetical protein